MAVKYKSLKDVPPTEATAVPTAAGRPVRLAIDRPAHEDIEAMYARGPFSVNTAEHIEAARNFEYRNNQQAERESLPRDVIDEQCARWFGASAAKRAFMLRRVGHVENNEGAYPVIDETEQENLIHYRYAYYCSTTGLYHWLYFDRNRNAVGVSRGPFSVNTASVRRMYDSAQRLRRRRRLHEAMEEQALTEQPIAPEGGNEE